MIASSSDVSLSSLVPFTLLHCLLCLLTCSTCLALPHFSRVGLISGGDRPDKLPQISSLEVAYIVVFVLFPNCFSDSQLLVREVEHYEISRSEPDNSTRWRPQHFFRVPNRNISLFMQEMGQSNDKFSQEIRRNQPLSPSPKSISPIWILLHLTSVKQLPKKSELHLEILVSSMLKIMEFQKTCRRNYTES